MRHKAYQRKDGLWGIKYKFIIWVIDDGLVFANKSDAFAYARARN